MNFFIILLLISLLACSEASLSEGPTKIITITHAVAIRYLS